VWLQFFFKVFFIRECFKIIILFFKIIFEINTSKYQNDMKIYIKNLFKAKKKYKKYFFKKYF
jgi:hypothetical protein